MAITFTNARQLSTTTTTVRGATIPGRLCVLLPL